MVRIEFQSGDAIPPDQEGDVSFGTFQEVRNVLVRTCKKHGPTGPMGFFPFDDADESKCLLEWMRTADPNPVYYVIADQFNAARYQRVECDTDSFTVAWILDLMKMLQDLPGWGVVVSGFPMGNVVVFAGKIMVIGDRFKEVADLESLIKNVQDDQLNKKLRDARPKSGKCLSYSLEGDRLVCNVVNSDGAADTLTLDRAQVHKVFQNPYTQDWLLSFKWCGGLDLPDEQTAMAIRKWHCGESK